MGAHAAYADLRDASADAWQSLSEHSRRQLTERVRETLTDDGQDMTYEALRGFVLGMTVGAALCDRDHALASLTAVALAEGWS